MNWFLAYVLRGLIFLLLWVGIVYPLTRIATRWIPEGRVKRILFRRFG